MPPEWNLISTSTYHHAITTHRSSTILPLAKRQNASRLLLSCSRGSKEVAKRYQRGIKEEELCWKLSQARVAMPIPRYQRGEIESGPSVYACSTGRSEEAKRYQRGGRAVKHSVDAGCSINSEVPKRRNWGVAQCL